MNLFSVLPIVAGSCRALAVASASYIAFLCANYASAMQPKKIVNEISYRAETQEYTFSGPMATLEKDRIFEEAQDLLGRGETEKEKEDARMQILGCWEDYYIDVNTVIDCLKLQPKNRQTSLRIDYLRARQVKATKFIEMFEHKGYATIFNNDVNNLDSLARQSSARSLRSTRRFNKELFEEIATSTIKSEVAEARLLAAEEANHKQELNSAIQEAADAEAAGARAALDATRKAAKNKKKKEAKAKKEQAAAISAAQTSRPLTEQEAQNHQRLIAARERAEAEAWQRSVELERQRAAEELSTKRQLRMLKEAIGLEAAASSRAGTGMGVAPAASVAASASPLRTWVINRELIEGALEGVMGIDADAIEAAINELHLNGINLSFNQSRPVGGGIFELRPRGSQGDWRVLFAFHNDGIRLLQLTTHDNLQTSLKQAIKDLTEIRRWSPPTPDEF